MIFSLSFAILLLTNNNVQKMDGNLDLKLTTEKSQIKEGDTFGINLVLSNIGNNTVNVWKMNEQISYNIHVYYQNGSKVPYECGVIQKPMLTNEYLIELSPGGFIEDTFTNSKCWNLEKGEYIINATYQTSSGEDITKPYWIGNIESNKVMIVVK